MVIITTILVKSNKSRCTNCVVGMIIQYFVRLQPALHNVVFSSPFRASFTHLIPALRNKAALKRGAVGSLAHSCSLGPLTK